MNNLILGEGLSLDTKVYRIISYKRFSELFSKGQNCLVRPKLWEDPYENFALNSPIDVMGTLGTIPFKDDIWAQCWSLNKASDAMWRIYSNGTDGFRIRSTVGKLIDGLSASLKKEEHPEISCFMGKVRYLKDQELTTFSKTQFAGGFDSDGQNLVETLLVKRKHFKHEREVRLIYFNQLGLPTSPDRHFYNFDPHTMIDQIMLHPQLSSKDARELKRKIRSSLNWKHELKQSKMYRPPEGFVFKVGP